MLAFKNEKGKNIAVEKCLYCLFASFAHCTVIC
jgi:hypothetical protein